MNDKLNNNISILPPFKKFCMTIGELPTSYVESMTYYESLVWLCNYLSQTVIPAINTNGEAVIELQEKFVELKSYVDNYFENLDVQTEIDNKLDEMAEQGELAEIIAAYLEVSSVLGFDTKSDLKGADNLISGSIARTLGDSTYSDGKGQFYRIRDLEEGDVIDDDLLVGLTNYPTLVAERIPTTNNSYDNLSSLLADDLLMPNSVVTIGGYYEACDGGDSSYFIRTKGIGESANNITTYQTNSGLIAEICDNSKSLYAKKYGVKCDSVSNDTTRLQALISYAYTTGKEVVLDGYAYVANTIDTKGVKIRGIGKTIHPDYTYTSKQYGYIGWDYLRNVNNGALITFADYVNDNLNTGSGIISDTANPIVSVSQNQGRFHLENLTICGWLRNNTQVGVKNVYDENDPPAYIYGAHRFDNVSVINCGSHGMELTNLEMTTLNKVYCMVNFGYGIYLNGSATINTPTEYVKFVDCRLCGNKLGGIMMSKSFNKSAIFDRCEFTADGLYNQLNLSVPENKEDIAAGITVSDYKNNQDNFIVTNCYAEQMNLLVKILTGTGTHVFNNIKITGNILYPTSSNSSILYLDTFYASKFQMNSNSNNNGDTFVLSANNGELIPFNCDATVLNDITTVPSLSFHANLNVTRNTIQRFGNMIYLCIQGTTTGAISHDANLITNLPKPIVDILLPFKYGSTYVFNTLWTNGIATCPVDLESGTNITIMGTYYVRPDTNKQGSY